MTNYTYVEAIAKGFPTVQVHAPGLGDVYEDIVWDAGAPLPSKETLDEWIAANPVSPDRRITVLAFRNRFTQAEKVTLDLASIDNPSASMQQRQLSAALRVMQQDLNTATFIDLSRADTIAGVNSLETYGIIGAGRASQILNAPIQEIERPVLHLVQ